MLTGVMRLAEKGRRMLSAVWLRKELSWDWLVVLRKKCLKRSSAFIAVIWGRGVVAVEGEGAAG